VTATIIDINNVACFGAHRKRNGGSDGGVPPYTYLWNNGQNGATAINLTAGN